MNQRQRNAILKAIQKAIILGIRANRDRIFSISQNTRSGY